MDKQNGKGFLLGTFLGAIVGAITALLFAPKSGKEIRGDIYEQANLMKDRSIQFKDSAVERGQEWIALAKEKSNHLAKTVSEQTNQVAGKVRQLKVKKQGDNDDEGSIENKRPRTIELTLGQEDKQQESES